MVDLFEFSNDRNIILKKQMNWAKCNNSCAFYTDENPTRYNNRTVNSKGYLKEKIHLE